MLPRPISALAAAVLTSALSSACGDDTASNAAPVELTRGDACGEAFFWAATPRGELAVTAGVEARGRARDAPTTIDVSLPDPRITVTVLRGENLPRNFCTDVLDGSAEPRSSQAASRGTGAVVLAPPNGCGVDGRLRLDGLVAADGTRFEPIRVRSSSIGCYAG